MKITKFVHSCLLVETPERVAIFDPGVMSYPAFDKSKLSRLDDIFITHTHPDHFHLPFVKGLVNLFPEVRITSTPEVIDQLKTKNIKGQIDPPEGVKFFDSPHENVKPLFPQPQEIGVHYLDLLTFPGDSHSFHETKTILALPITGPWGSSIRALNLALELKPKYIMPIHDWHWSEKARVQTYDRYAEILAKEGITLYKPETGQPIDIPA